MFVLDHETVLCSSKGDYIEALFFGDGVVWQENERNNSREGEARCQRKACYSCP